MVVQGKVIGALNVYSGQPDAFDDAEIGMLIELASDISLGVEKIRQREALHQNEEKFRSLYQAMNEDVGLHKVIHDESGKAVDYMIIDVNPPMNQYLV